MKKYLYRDKTTDEYFESDELLLDEHVVLIQMIKDAHIKEDNKKIRRKLYGSY